MAPTLRPLRISLAYDGSPAAERAVGVVARATWPTGTSVRIVTSPVGIEPLSSLSGIAEAQAGSRQITADIQRAQDRVAGVLAGSGLTVEAAVLHGSPGEAIVADAAAVGADLLVAGGRTHRSIAATLVGSVATELSARAPCSVLIVRVESFERVLLATDGSAAASTAVDLVGHWPAFGSAVVRVLGVAPRPPIYAGQALSTEELDAAYADDAETMGPIEAAAFEARTRLDRAERAVTHGVRVGDPAAELVAAAREWPADVVVVGATGRSGVERLLVGSVARTVLHEVHCSVLTVRPPVGAGGIADSRPA